MHAQLLISQCIYMQTNMHIIISPTGLLTCFHDFSNPGSVPRTLEQHSWSHLQHDQDGPRKFQPYKGGRYIQAADNFRKFTNKSWLHDLRLDPPWDGPSSQGLLELLHYVYYLCLFAPTNTLSRFIDLETNMRDDNNNNYGQYFLSFIETSALIGAWKSKFPAF